MSDPGRLPVRLPRAQPGESPAQARAPAGDLRPRFSDLLRQRRPVESDDAMRSPGDTTLAPIDPLELPLPDEAGDEVEEDDAAAAREAAWLLPEPVAALPAAPLTPPEIAAGGAARAAQAQTVQLNAPPQVTRLADTVAHFCNDRAVTAGDSWQVQIELRPDLLPASTLVLSLSPHWLCLRFDIRDDGARHLVFTHRHALAEQLEGALVRRREISVTFD